jgi:hypothetical protein
MAISSRNQLWSELNGNVSLLYKLEGNAPCGPACGVLWELGERNPRLPDSALFDSGPSLRLLLNPRNL